MEDWYIAAIYLGLGLAIGGLLCVLLERARWIAKRSALAGVFIILGRLTILLGIAVALVGIVAHRPSMWWWAALGLVIGLIAAVGMLLYAARTAPEPAAKPAAPEPAPAPSRAERKAAARAAEKAAKAEAADPASPSSGVGAPAPTPTHSPSAGETVHADTPAPVDRVIIPPSSPRTTGGDGPAKP